ncbi:zeatin O-xylosyltransferase [Ziziphus jujuba]|uniref:Glycosyltransferase n=1 Tax=Ziziphus jujuba TaxID=326968 RepID=A0A6P3ZU41_ZIZJJ|nr:zeatin O-xylosyltransferase [Ziziphus jujuba]
MATHHQHQHEQQKHENLSIKDASVIVVMVPFPVHSHMNQLLQLSCLISSYKIPVHYAGSSIHNSQVRTRAHALNLSEIQFHDFPIPPFVPEFHDFSIPPTSYSTEFLLPYFHVTEHLRQPVGALIHQLSSKAKRIIIIHDVLTSSVVQDAISITNAETYFFQATTVFTVFCFSCAASSEKFLPIPSELAHEIKDPIEIPSTEGAFSYQTTNFLTRQTQFVKSLSALGTLYNACKVIDGAFLDLLVEKQNDKKGWPIGPLHQVTYNSKNIGRNSINGRDKCLEWLDKQEPDCVLYISFGTTISMGDHDQQLKELALGLELSEAKFIWVFTDADHKKDGLVESEKGRHELPEGFEDRVKGKGMVVRDWAPQLEILQHKSTGGFLSHCGWNSCLESISYGVPIATWPMHSDQPMNALLITDVLKIGVNVKEWRRRDQVVSSSEISKALRRLMGSDEGDEMRKRAKDLGDKVRSATADGGVSRLECDSFIAHITR